MASVSGLTRGAEVRAVGFGLTPAGATAPVFTGLDLAVEPGQVVLLAGPSGVGKTTLLHAMAGLLEADDADDAGPAGPEGAAHGVVVSGSLSVDGGPPRGGRVGLVQQDPETQVVMARIGDDVAFGAENLGTDPETIWGRVRKALSDVGLGDLPLNHPTQALSGGQKQRLAVAGLLAMGPRLWLLDEPTANLDPEGAERLRDVVIRAAGETGATVVIVEHRLELWLDHVDRLAVLAPADGDDAGSIVADGPPENLLAQPAVVETLLGAGVWVPGHEPALPAPPRREPGETLLTARGLSATREALPRRRGARTRTAAAVTDVGLTVSAGQATCLMGRNGEGKTALALTLAGLQRLRSGSLLATDALRAGARKPEPERFRARELVRRIGMVFQDPEHQFVTRRVRDELGFGPRKAGEDPDTVQARVEELLTRLHLHHVAEMNPYQLSGGQQRRLSVGTALAARPQLLVLDEPTFGQDANTWRDLVMLLREELERGTAIVAVTHEDGFAAALGARVIRVAGGAACELR